MLHKLHNVYSINSIEFEPYNRKKKKKLYTNRKPRHGMFGI